MLEQLAKKTHYTKDMQRFYLACIDEFGEDFRQFIEGLIVEATKKGSVEYADTGRCKDKKTSLL
jgi:hypothetical protein